MSYFDLVTILRADLPCTFLEHPCVDSRTKALLQYTTDPENQNYNHLCHLHDEKQDMVAVSNWVDMHPIVRAAVENHWPYNAPNWTHTNSH